MSKHVGLGLVLSLFSLAVAGCSAAPAGAGGSSGSSGASSSGGSSGSSGSSGGAPVTEITEVEPNNGPGLAGMQNLGVLDGSATLEIKGRLDSGGMNSTSYTGDFDGFAFEIKATGGSLSTTVDWSGSADVDAILYDANLNPVAADNTTAKPISKTGAIPPGKYAVVLFSKDQAADWTMKLSYSTTSTGSSSGGSSSGSSGATGGTGCIDAATLSGGYWQKMHGGLEEIRFNDGGGLDYGSANPVSGTVWYTGSWTLSCPTLTANITSSTPYTYTVNGTTLTDQNGVAWVRCTPISSGECF